MSEASIVGQRLSKLAVCTLSSMVAQEPFERAPSHLMGDFATQYDVEFKHLQFSVPSKKGGKPHTLILKGVSGYCRSARLTAIMGASGAGEVQLATMLHLYLVNPFALCVVFDAL